MESSPLLERRRAMAEILAEVHAVAAERYGQEEADRLIEESVSRSAIKEGEEFAGLQGGADLRSFAKVLDRWTANGALEIELLRATGEVLEFNVTRCRFAELYRSMGLLHIGELLSCNRDGRFCEGFNPAIRLKRTGTIMSGAPLCDFRFTLSPSKAETQDEPVD